MSKLLGNLWSWISPKKTIERREKPFKAPPYPITARPGARRRDRFQISKNQTYDRSASPSGQLIKWGQASSSPSVIFDSVETTPPGCNRSAPHVHSDGEEADGEESEEDQIKQEAVTEEEFEIDEDNEDDQESEDEEDDDNSEDDTSSPNTAHTSFALDSTLTSFAEQDSFDANTQTKVIDTDRDDEAALAAATREHVMDLHATIARQKLEAQHMMADGWAWDTVELYMLIGRRAFEKLFPTSWIWDFPLFPANVFTDKEEDAFLKNSKGSFPYARNEINKICQLGPSVRNSVRHYNWLGRRPEGVIENAIKKYIKWAYRDSKIQRDVRKKRLLPLIAFASAFPGDNTDKLELSITNKLRKLSTRHLDMLRVASPELLSSLNADSPYFFHEGNAYLYEPPTLYGFVTIQTVVALVAYEPLSGRDGLRTIAFFHYSKPHYDVWNSLALAMVVVYCRDHMLAMSKVLPELEGEETVDEYNMSS